MGLKIEDVGRDHTASTARWVMMEDRRPFSMLIVCMSLDDYGPNCLYIVPFLMSPKHNIAPFSMYCASGAILTLPTIYNMLTCTAKQLPLIHLLPELAIVTSVRVHPNTYYAATCCLYILSHLRLGRRNYVAPDVVNDGRVLLIRRQKNMIAPVPPMPKAIGGAREAMMGVAQPIEGSHFCPALKYLPSTSH